MTKAKFEGFLANELIAHISTFFHPPWQRNKAKAVCRQWDEAIVPCYHFFILGGPISVQTAEAGAGQERQWKQQFSEEDIKQSLAAVPNDGFMIFSKYRDAYLYAHNSFTRTMDNPNFNNGIHGTGCLKEVFFVKRTSDKLLYHPVIFEVIFDNHKTLDLTWHDFTFRNLGNENMKISVSAIREPGCKNHLEIIASKIAIGFVNNEPISPVTLYTSKVNQHKEEASAEQKEEY
ncbi:Uncharacterised protein [Legionella lansingensis]|uniref:Uncharacterized protein n=1 Tax=Legionella lansingensis TaxID=45067 RepID=A0A0W0VLG3_9GAMM|nr:hypothetical protein [Legionella lansingensis]KTD20938.1 hypothetical protein Llan_1668 [Legionella lansingensis]SNV44397.1 Uncharacterised protein [Legionella lansingensis]